MSQKSSGKFLKASKASSSDSVSSSKFCKNTEFKKHISSSKNDAKLYSLKHFNRLSPMKKPSILQSPEQGHHNKHNLMTDGEKKKENAFMSSIDASHRQVIDLEFLSPIQTGHLEPESILTERLKQAETLSKSKDPLHSIFLLRKWGYLPSELESHLRNHFPSKGSLLTLDEQIFFMQEIQVKVINHFINTIKDIKNFYCYSCIPGIVINATNIINDLYQLKIARLQNGIVVEP